MPSLDWRISHFSAPFAHYFVTELILNFFKFHTILINNCHRSWSLAFRIVAVIIIIKNTIHIFSQNGLWGFIHNNPLVLVGSHTSLHHVYLVCSDTEDSITSSVSRFHSLSNSPYSFYLTVKQTPFYKTTHINR